MNNPYPYTIRWAYNFHDKRQCRPDGLAEHRRNLGDDDRLRGGSWLWGDASTGDRRRQQHACRGRLRPAEPLRQRLARLRRWAQHSERNGRRSVLSVGDDAEDDAGQEQRSDDRRDRHALGFAAGDDNLGYHLVWSRDMFKPANALITAGTTRPLPPQCVGFSTPTSTREGRFPQNAFVSGIPFRNAVQMDEQAIPIILAYRLGPPSRSAVAADQSHSELHLQQWPVDRAGTLGGDERLFAVDHSR